MHLFGGQNGDVPHPPPRLNRAAVRDELTRTDPDFARVRQAHHDALQVLTARGIRDGLAIHRERRFWERRHAQGHDPS